MMNTNIVWKVESVDGFVDTSFEHLAMAGVNQFQFCFKSYGRATIAEVVNRPNGLSPLY